MPPPPTRAEARAGAGPETKQIPRPVDAVPPSASQANSAQQQIVCRARHQSGVRSCARKRRKRGGKRRRVPRKQCPHARFRLRVRPPSASSVHERRSRANSSARTSSDAAAFPCSILKRYDVPQIPRQSPSWLQARAKALAANQKAPQCSSLSPLPQYIISHRKGKSSFSRPQTQDTQSSLLFHSSPVAFATQSKVENTLLFNLRMI